MRAKHLGCKRGFVICCLFVYLFACLFICLFVCFRFSLGDSCPQRWHPFIPWLTRPRYTCQQKLETPGPRFGSQRLVSRHHWSRQDRSRESVLLYVASVDTRERLQCHIPSVSGCFEASLYPASRPCHSTLLSNGSSALRALTKCDISKCLWKRYICQADVGENVIEQDIEGPQSQKERKPTEIAIQSQN